MKSGNAAAEMPKLPAGHFLGRTLNARALPGFRLTETIYASGLRLPRHAHELAKYCFVLAGSFIETVGQQRRLRQPLTLAFQPADTKRRMKRRANIS